MNTDLKSFSQTELINGIYYRLLSFDHLLTSNEELSLNQMGIEIVEYIPDRNYLTRIRPNSTRENIPIKGLLACMQLKPSYKLSSSLLYGGSCDEVNGRSRLVMQFFEDIGVGSFKDHLEQAGLLVEDVFAYDQIAYVQATPDELSWLSRQAFVKFIDCRAQPGVPEDREGRNLHRVNAIASNIKENIFLDGSGVKVMVRDDGFVGPHIDFQGRIQQDVYNDIGNHGDGVSGVLTGAGNYDPLVQGMAPGANLYILNYQPDFLDKTLDYHQQHGVVITNSSYSNGCNAGYTIEAQVVDKQLYENRELLHVFSAGNSNNVDCGYGAGNQWGNVTGGHKIGKNALTVANLKLDGTLETSSSRGPTKDGRMKPEISARGTNELSTDQDNGTQVFGGTSAASPGVAGVCALLYQAYKNLHGGANPESALIKAAVMNTATDIGTPGPDYQFGFGVVNAYRAYKLLAAGNYVKKSIQHGQSLEFKVTVPKGTVLAKFMLYWPEQQSSLLSSKALINDLDVVVTNPKGTELKPWVLNPTPNPTSLAAGASLGIDTLNNVEQVSINSPEEGEYLIRITGKSIPTQTQDFYFLFEMDDQALRLSHPIGGEKFNITEFTQIQFTAYGTDSISAFLTTDGGHNWSFLGSKQSGSRLMDIYLPNNISSDSCMIEIRQGSAVQRSGFFTVTNGVQGFKFSKYCPNELELSWVGAGKDSFQIYQLGKAYMDPIAISKDTRITLPNESPNSKKWFSIAGFKATALSRRELAIASPDTMIACGFIRDLSLKVSPDNQPRYYSCGTSYLLPAFLVINRGPSEMNDVRINIQSDSGLVSQDFQLVLAPYDTIGVQFTKPVPAKGSGTHSYTAWLEQTSDQNPYNDSSVVSVELDALPDQQGLYPIKEEFQTSTLPNDWIMSNQLDNSNWQIVQVKGKDGLTGKALMHTNPNPVYRKQVLLLTSKTADLSNSVEPYLYFDFVHHQFTTTPYLDSLRIVVKQVCGTVQREKVLFNGNSEEMRTVDTTSLQNWTPVDSSWYWMAFDLSEFKGTKIVVEFQLFRGQSSRTFLDNFEIREKYPQTGQLDFNIDPYPGCYTKQISYTESGSIQNPELYFDAGLGGNPRFFSGPGPYKTRYTAQGSKRLVLRAKSKTSNDVIVIKDLPLYNAVLINFSYTRISGRTVSFTNTSVNGLNYFWDFGDGTNSTEYSPVHTFDSAKIYRVKLTITNPCGSYNRSVNVDLTATATHESSEIGPVKIYPNPFSNKLSIQSEEEILEMIISNFEGKVFKHVEGIKLNKFDTDLLDMAKGIYLLEIHTNKNVYWFPIQKI